jgi:tRNA threonylcarbamoyladenosine biosynthesis protein TsaE
MQFLELTLSTHGPDETLALGRHMGSLLEAGDVVALIGDLGAGKTCLAKGIARGLDVPESSYVRSPSFMILNMYPGRHTLHHLDLYRIHSPAELEDLGYREIFYGEGVTVIEWADKIDSLLPEEHLRVCLDFQDETGRVITLAGIGNRYRERWAAFHASLAQFAGS